MCSSAGVGVTPVLAVLGAFAQAGSQRPLWWVHGARSGAEHAFAAETRDLLSRLPAGRSHVRYSRPRPEDRQGVDFDDVAGSTSTCYSGSAFLSTPTSTCAAPPDSCAG